MKTHIQTIEELRDHRILLSALNWGMGHLTRSIALISQLREQGNVVVFAGSDWQQSYLSTYFPNLLMLDLPDYPFHFRGKRFILDLSLNIPSLLRHTKKEAALIDGMVKEYQIDLVLADHRYASRSRNCVSVFITHQYVLPLKKWHLPAQLIHRFWMRRFDQIWIMDDEHEKLAGKLSTTTDSRARYIGHFSRFQLYTPTKKVFPLVLLISGPKLYAQQFVNELGRRFHESCPVICSAELTLPAHFKRVEGGPLEEDSVLLGAKKIISRCGYSTLMDVKILNCDADLFPTEGQLEQEYLAYLHGFNGTHV